jgi:hypothetical protein
MTCSKCGYTFAFDPKADGMTDTKFASLLRKASVDNTQYFTINQLYALYCKGRTRTIAAVIRVVVRPSGKLGTLVALGGIAAVVYGNVLASAGVMALGVMATVLGVMLRLWGRDKIEDAPEKILPAEMGKLLEHVGKWRAAGKNIDRLIEAPSLHEPPATFREPDIYDYGVERVIVVQHDILVDLFVRNNLHATQRAVVIAESGYPHYLVARVQHLLQRRADLPIVAFHDATAEGVQMARRLRTLPWLGMGSHRIIDAGLFPGDVGRIKSLESTLPATYGNAARADFMPLGVIAGGFAGLAAMQALPPTAADAAAAKRPTDSGGGGDGGGAADFSGDPDSGDGDFG